MKVRRKYKAFMRRHSEHVALVAGIICGLIFGLLFWSREMPSGFISPCPKDGCEMQAGESAEIKKIITPTIAPKPTEKPTPRSQGQMIRGIASYYSVAGCLGCSPSLTMANGEPLDDSRLTLAYNHAPMNTVVTIRNVRNNRTVQATITDTGGFGPLGRIADLSVATKNAIECSSLCEVEIEL